jgi:DNA-binding SARP family transcriptional activator
MSADTVAAETELTEFGILGPLEVSRRGRAVPLAGPRQRAVLALLLLEANRTVSMDRLAEDIWGGEPPDGWITTLQTYVFHLRQALEPGRARGAGSGVLVTRNRGYLLRVDREHLDAARFQDGLTAGRATLEAGRYAEAAGTLRGALELWRGGVLADLADYAFTRPEAARLEELRLAALEARIDADLALGEHSTLTGELEQLAAKHPLREGLHGQLMLALYRCGRQADALAAYRRAHLLLAGELGIDPGEALQRRAPPGHRYPGGLAATGTTFPAGRAWPRAGPGPAANPASAGHRLGAGGGRDRLRRHRGPAVGRRAGRPVVQQREPDQPIRGTGGRPGERGQPGWSGLRRRGGLDRRQHQRHAGPDRPGYSCVAEDPGRVRAERGRDNRPRRLGHQQRRRNGVTGQHRDRQSCRDDPGRQPPGGHRGRERRRVGSQPR